MNLSGTAFLALWNGVAPGHLSAYQDWHGIEHVPERLTVPGMLAAWRYQAGDGDQAHFFTLYDLASIEVLDTPAYQRLINQPSPESIRMRPHLTGFTRIICRIAARQASPSAAFIVPLVTAEAISRDGASAGSGLAIQHGVIAADAPGHPLARATPTTGSVLLVDADDPAVLRAEIARRAPAAAATTSAFRLIGDFLPAG
ncbi:hypothetical protein [Phreatobacter stygius]|uniref:Uncharacterized protein n=1 Tax=Phreatobacter stygius TaxID=1940610 RepID=A0A4D7B4P9_9HYPH|nr:hypothetical protein [Phreatobacter stygius]QCI65993.1 hypothetical protein E8M01_18325 [Phreatobacter stygius]